ncbi:unnamed protein product [Sphagnum balticum]
MERSVAQALLETWWNEDPEMRYAVINCGNDYRCHVTLWQIFWDEPHERPLGYGEAGDLESAIQIAIADAKQKGNN